MPKHLNSDGDFEMVEIGRLKPHSRNTNQGDFGAIQQSIEANGFFGALVVQRSTRQILAGNHRYHVAKQLGYDRLPVTWVDVDDERALRILLADNATARAGNDDPNALAELLAELAGTQEGLTGTGYDGDALDQLISDLANPLTSTPAANDPNAEWQGMPEFSHDNQRPYRTLLVHFADEAAVNAFASLIAQPIGLAAKSIWHPKQHREDLGQMVYSCDA